MPNDALPFFGSRLVEPMTSFQRQIVHCLTTTHAKRPSLQTSPNTRAGSINAAPPRIEPQYLQAAVTYWALLSTLIWQQLVMIVVIQSFLVSAGVIYAPSLISVGAFLLAFILSSLVGIQMWSNVRVRQQVTLQANYMSEQLLRPFFARRNNIPPEMRVPFVLYDPSLDHQQWFVRSPVAVLCVIFFTFIFDALALAVFNLPRFFIELLSGIPLPLFKQGASFI